MSGITERETILQLSDSFKRASSHIKQNNFQAAAENLKTASVSAKHLSVIQQKSDLMLIGAMIDHVRDNCFTVATAGIQLDGMSKARFGNTVEHIAHRCRALWEMRSVSRAETIGALDRFGEAVGTADAKH